MPQYDVRSGMLIKKSISVYSKQKKINRRNRWAAESNVLCFYNLEGRITLIEEERKTRTKQGGRGPKIDENEYDFGNNITKK